MTTVQRGRLGDSSSAPSSGELVELVATIGDTRIEHILSGMLGEPLAFAQDDDEWVVVIAGQGQLDIGGTIHDLVAGDWIFIPAGVPHEVMSTDQGTSWLAVHVRAAS